MTEETHQDRTDVSGRRLSRRKLLAASGLAGTSALAGCFGLLGGGNGTPSGGVGLAQFRGSGPLVEGRGDLGGTHISDLPDLSGTLNLYVGGGEGGLYIDLLDLFTRIYDDFQYNKQVAPSASLANRIVREVEGGASRADVFISVEAGSLASVAQAGAAEPLPSAVTSMPDSDFATDRWVGVAGRARSVPYNTNQLSEGDVPDSVQAFPETAAFRNDIGWAPTYGAFQSFITAMRLLRGDETTREWLNAMQAHGAVEYPDEFLVSNGVADGEIAAGFANHYYALRVRNARPDAPLDLAFTKNDAGALINTSGGLVIEGSNKRDLAETLLRHLLSAQAQEFFATRAFAYPTVPAIPPVGGLPSIEELDPPEVSLTKLSNLNETIDLMRETGVL